MKWINATNLEFWAANRTGARAELVTLVGELIQVTAREITAFRFPDGDKAQVRGFDGELNSVNEAFCIPSGESKWEFGVSKGVSKANEDYKSCTEKTHEDIRKVSILVMVNPNTWDSSKAENSIDNWLKRINDEGQWRGIRYIDGAQLETWLDMHPAVAAKFARNVLNLMPQEGCQCLDEFWDQFSSKFSRRLAESVLLADRQEDAQQLREKMLGPAQSWVMGADSEDEGIAFAIAAIRTAEEPTRAALMSRTIIVESVSAARALAAKENLIIVAKGAATESAGYLGKRAPTLSIAVGIQARTVKSLPRPSANAMSKALQEMGFSQDEAYELAVNCARSIAILRRRIPSATFPDPPWVSHRTDLLGAILAGGWSTKSNLDKTVLTKLSNSDSYAHFEKSIRPTLDYADRPFDQIQDVWQLRSAVDAFPYIASLVGEDERERFKAAVFAVFGTAIAEPKADEQFSLHYRPADSYSDWLSDGLAITLVLIATLGESNNFNAGDNGPQAYVNEIVSALPDWGRSHRSLKMIGSQLTIIAEAAPIPFLSALEGMLKGYPEEITSFFSESTDFFAPSSLHVSILFALEMLAWDPKYFNQVCIVLAGLAEADPGGKLANRPINSLRSILVPWSPNTYASQFHRLACIEEIIRNFPDIGWTLLSKLLPNSHDHNDLNSKPRLRDCLPLEPELLTFGHVWEANSFIVDRAILLAGNKQERVLSLLTHSGGFSPDDKAKLRTKVDKYLSEHSEAERNPIWFELQRQIQRHQTYATAEWAMSQSDLNTFIDVLEKYRPQGEIAQIRWLFDDWLPSVSEEAILTGNDSVEDQRSSALISILKNRGGTGILELLSTAKQPTLICDALQNADVTLDQFLIIFNVILNTQEFKARLLSTLSAIGLMKFGNEWKNKVKKIIAENDLDVETSSLLILQWPAGMETWSFAAELETSIEKQYWETMSNLPQAGDLTDLGFAVNKLRECGRPLTVIRSASRRLKELSGTLLLQLLDEGINDLNREAKFDNNMLVYYLSKVFDELPLKDDITEQEIARREFVYLPLLAEERRSFLIHKLMATDPAFFIEVISAVFRAKNSSDDEPTETERTYAHHAYKVLEGFHRIPGEKDGDVDPEILRAWVLSARDLANSADRAQIADLYIGYLLAHSPADKLDKLWPHANVRMLIEELSNDDVERGISTERFNMRGVYSRAMGEGGNQEKEIALRYRRWATGVQSHPRVSKLLKRMADNWDDMAKEQDVKAEQERLKR